MKHEQKWINYLFILEAIKVYRDWRFLYLYSIPMDGFQIKLGSQIHAKWSFNGRKWGTKEKEAKKMKIKYKIYSLDLCCILYLINILNSKPKIDERSVVQSLMSSISMLKHCIVPCSLLAPDNPLASLTIASPPANRKVPTFTILFCFLVTENYSYILICQNSAIKWPLGFCWPFWCLWRWCHFVWCLDNKVYDAELKWKKNGEKLIKNHDFAPFGLTTQPMIRAQSLKMPTLRPTWSAKSSAIGLWHCLKAQNMPANGVVRSLPFCNQWAPTPS
jgi:hypothetical protein